MRVTQDREEQNHYLQAYQLETVFPEELQAHMTLCYLERGELICSQGASADTLYVLVSGKLKIFTNSQEGKTLILSFKTPLEVIGDIEYVREMETMNTVEAVAPSVLLAVPFRFLRKYASNHAPFLHFLLEIITKKFTVKSNDLSFNLLYPVEVRLASYLLSVCFEDGDSSLRGQVSSASLSDAANLIGTSSRHVNRVLQQFRQAGLVEREKTHLLIKDRQGLQKVANPHLYE
ncbi:MULTISPECIES: Crp/Fnr family transcriptional regulator [Brevibacillus]|uniref:Crp/Fnr family transcriptional regulator n=1 Tax=Brevibacillus TaxID=55080 RepID=UPI00156B93B2|nr:MULTISPECIES: cyclic nucleotide-binding domain-containing protein [Brevibacillus]MED1726011.1 cyclic nucleotide-binding domain-containing protein [Brevibacillus parabrevis]NRQ55514.1 cyclic nucleotide-binding domain-containing protein [Brevibacillus sp. HD1.4A]